MALKRMKFMNTYLDNVTTAEEVEHIESCIKECRIGQVITPNVDQIVRIEHYTINEMLRGLHADMLFTGMGV